MERKNVTTKNFECDAAKARQNQIQHGIKFELAAQVFFDPYRIEIYDGREDYGEDRWATIGYAGLALLFVVYTVRDGETIRLISARKANARERQQYHQIHP